MYETSNLVVAIGAIFGATWALKTRDKTIEKAEKLWGFRTPKLFAITMIILMYLLGIFALIEYFTGWRPFRF